VDVIKWLLSLEGCRADVMAGNLRAIGTAFAEQPNE